MTYLYSGARESTLDPVATRVAVDPLFGELVRKRDRSSLVIVVLAMVVYFGYIFLLAFAPGFMSTPVAGVITVGFPLALFVVLFNVVLVGLFVWQANGPFERLREKIVMEARR